MSNLSKETIEKINADALEYGKYASLVSPHIAYAAGATEEAEKARGLVDALEDLLKQLPSGNSLNFYFAKEQVIKARKQLVKYKEVTNEQ